MTAAPSPYSKKQSSKDDLQSEPSQDNNNIKHVFASDMNISILDPSLNKDSTSNTRYEIEDGEVILTSGLSNRKSKETSNELVSPEIN